MSNTIQTNCTRDPKVAGSNPWLSWKTKSEVHSPSRHEDHIVDAENEGQRNIPPLAYQEAWNANMADRFLCPSAN